MTATIDELQAAIKSTLDTIGGLHAQATEPETPYFPTAYPRLVSWTFDQEFMDAHGSSMTYLFDIWVVVDLVGGLNRAQTALNPYLSPSGRKSIKVAMDADPTLGHVASSSRLIGGGAYGRTELAGIAALAASQRLEVYA